MTKIRRRQDGFDSGSNRQGTGTLIPFKRSNSRFWPKPVKELDLAQTAQEQGHLLGLFETIKADFPLREKKNAFVLRLIVGIFTSPCLSAVVFHRCAAHFSKKGLFGKIVAKILWRCNVLINSCDIANEADIAPGFGMPHPAGVVIGGCRIGRNVSIFQNVTLGALNPREAGWEDTLDCYPTLEDDVTVYSGAVVVGPVTIGKGTVIGANTVVARDLPPDSLAVGGALRVLPKS